MFKYTQYGRSMIEMLGVLAIIGILSIGGIAGYSKAISAFKVNKTVEQILNIAEATHKLYLKQRDYSDLNFQVLFRSKTLSDDLLADAYDTGYGYSMENTVMIENPLGGYTSIDGEHNHFKLVLHDVPQNECIKIASQDWARIGVGFIGVGVNVLSSHLYPGCNNDLDYFGGTKYCGESIPLNVAQRACFAEHDNVIVFSFR